MKRATLAALICLVLYAVLSSDDPGLASNEMSLSAAYSRVISVKHGELAPPTPANVSEGVQVLSKKVSRIRAARNDLRVLQLVRLLGNSNIPVGPAVAFVGSKPHEAATDAIRFDDAAGFVYLIVAGEPKWPTGREKVPKRVTVASLDKEGDVWCSTATATSVTVAARC